MAWERLAHVELSSDGDTLDSGTFTAKKNMKVIVYLKGTADVTRGQYRFNADTGSNYASRRSSNGGSDGTDTSDTSLQFTNQMSLYNAYTVTEITNIADKEKLCINHTTVSEGTGAGNAPASHEVVGKWANTSNQITRIQVYNDDSGDYEAGSYITVLGAKEPATADTITVDGGEDNTVTTSEDFSSNNTSTTGSSIAYANTQWELDGTYGSSNETKSTVDIGSTLSDTKWVMRCKYDLDGWSDNSSSAKFISAGIGISSASNSTSASSTQDWIGFSLFSQSGAVHEFKAQGTNDSSITGGNWTGFGSSPSIATGTYYVEITRQSATSMKVEVFSDSDYSTSLGSQTRTIDSGLSSLRYITLYWFSEGSGTSGTMSLNIDDIKIYNTVSQVRKGFTAKKHLMIQTKIIASGTTNARLRFNNDTGSNYADRKSSNGGTDGTVTSQTSIRIGTGVSADQNQLNTINVINEASKEKLVISESVKSATGAGTAPDRQEAVGKWANTSNQITKVDIINTDSGDFAEGSEVTVYGTD